MFLWLPDSSSDLDDLQMLAIRRYLELYQAVEDHYDHLDELEHGLESDDSKVIASISASCGYVLRLELRKRIQSIETGFTLVQQNPSLRTSLIRFYRRSSGGPWRGFQLNKEFGSHEMRRLCKSFGLDAPSKRYEFSDLAVNSVFGKACWMTLYGFMSR